MPVGITKQRIVCIPMGSPAGSNQIKDKCTQIKRCAIPLSPKNTRFITLFPRTLLQVNSATWWNPTTETDPLNCAARDTGNRAVWGHFRLCIHDLISFGTRKGQIPDTVFVSCELLLLRLYVLLLLCFWDSSGRHALCLILKLICCTGHLWLNVCLSSCLHACMQVFLLACLCISVSLLHCWLVTREKGKEGRER